MRKAGLQEKSAAQVIEFNCVVELNSNPSLLIAKPCVGERSKGSSKETNSWLAAAVPGKWRMRTL